MENEEGKLIGGTVTPAYGRDYKSKAEAQHAFRTGKDFRLHLPYGSTYCSIRDFAEGAQVQIRYDKMEKVFVEVV